MSECQTLAHPTRTLSDLHDYTVALMQEREYNCLIHNRQLFVPHNQPNTDSDDLSHFMNNIILRPGTEDDFFKPIEAFPSREEKALRYCHIYTNDNKHMESMFCGSTLFHFVRYGVQWDWR